jgi:superfamily II DNA or RNA helicase
MVLKEWQSEALFKKRVVVRAARGAGKTVLAIKWARKVAIGKRVLFCVANQSAVMTTVESFKTLLGSEVASIRRDTGEIGFRDGTRVYVVSLSNELALRGQRCDAVVLDDAGLMTDHMVLSALVCVAHVADFSFLATYSSAPKNGLKIFKKLGDVHYITYDYLDMLESGMIKASTVRDIKQYMTERAFAEEFGPYEKMKTVKGKNITFKHLLDIKLW